MANKTPMIKSKLCFIFAAILAVGCGDDEESPSYAKADLIGKWEMTSTTSQEFNPDDCTVYHRYYEFSEAEFTDSNDCDGATSSFGIEYDYNGKNEISYTFIVGAKLVIKELTATSLKLDEYVSGTKMGTSIFTRVD
jgi:hypothetical protein